MALTSLLVALHFAFSLVLAVPHSGLKFNARADLPELTLSYGTWRANQYDASRDIYTFKNIRYAAPPTGSRRFAKPEPPDVEDEVQDGSYGNVCPQARSQQNILGPVNQIPGVSGALNGFLSGLAPTVTGNRTIGQEDCLFLDLYVPGDAIRGGVKGLPVIVWTHGGVFLFGSKDQGMNVLPLYKGNGPMQQARNRYIFVSYNYRVGAFGFLAGTTMESEGQPNAGFYDQRMLYEWVQSYISLVGGDKSQVIAWGESAGATSIMHHLTAFGGKQDPLFRRAVLQSIPSRLSIDRRGRIESIYKEFEALAGCTDQGLSCLRATPADVLFRANINLTSNVPPGAVKVGPSADGKWVRQTPALEFGSGNHWKDVDGLLLSHVRDEPEVFTTGEIQSDEQFEKLVQFIVPEYAPQIYSALLGFYPSPGQTGSPFRTQTDRVKQYLTDTVLVCNNRYMAKAYDGKVWAMQYSVTPGWHATDLLPTFYDASFSLAAFNASLQVPLVPGFGGLSLAYQSYLNSFSLNGDPNTERAQLNLPPTIPWPKLANVNEENLEGVLDVGDLGFSLIEDKVSLKSRCDFFLQIQAGITRGGGYTPENGELQPGWP